MSAFWDDLVEDMKDPEYVKAHISALAALAAVLGHAAGERTLEPESEAGE